MNVGASDQSKTPPPNRSWIASAAVGSARVVLPPSCLTCGVPTSNEGALCSDCWGSLSLIERPYCDRLAVPFVYDHGPGTLSAEAIADPPPFERMRAAVLYEGVARQLVQGLKYGDHLELIRWMANWMARAGSEIIAEADIIVPVPLHWRRLWHRRFNQSAALADAIARKTDKPVALAAVKSVRPTRNQVGLGEKARSANVRGAFGLDDRRRPDVAGRRVLVIDDVYTTGATMKAVTRALKRCRANAVDALVFARVAQEAG